MRQPWRTFWPAMVKYLDEDGLLPVFVLGLDDSIEYCNKAFQSLLEHDESPLGRDLGQLFGADFSAVFKIAAERPLHHKIIWHVQTIRESLRFECHMYCEGDRRLVIAEKPVITGDDIIAKLGSFNQELTAMARDLTKRNAAAESANRKLQTEIAKTMAQAERLSTLAAMAAGVVHEIAQPLTAIKGIADCAVLWRGGDQTVWPDDVLSDMEVISQQAARIDKIIKHMRSLVHKHRMEIGACNLNKTVEYILGEVQAKASDNEISLSSSLDQELPLVLGNAVGIAEVVVNLTANAIKALGQTDNPHKAIAVRTARSGEYAALEISDNGPGIEEAIRGKIFEPFFTTDSTAGGMGLGLSIVRAIVAAHDGHIAVFANDSQGTTFRVELPLVAPV
jgi:C4-dicarboxylate-specific signal transduction histidine kinase